jgi:hypothetical protein
VRRTARDIARFLACSSVETAQRRLEAAMNELGLERRLTVLGIRTAADRRRIIEDVDPARAGNHPRHLSPAALRRILVALG